MPLTYWPQAFATATFLINRMTTPVLQNTSPYQKLFQTLPNYSKLRTFGCLCYPWLRPYAPNKLKHRSTPCVFIGYSLTQSAYLCLDPTTDRVYTSRHERFNETEYPYTKLRQPPPIIPPEPVHPQTPYQPHTTITPQPTLVQSPTVTQESSPPSSETLPQASTSSSSPPPPQQTTTLAPNIATATEVPPSTVEVATHQPQPTTDAQTLTAPPVAPPQRHSMTTRSRNNIVKPVSRYNLSVNLQTDPHWIPTTWQQAMKHPKWRAEMLAEFNSQIKNRTWDLETTCKGMNVVGCH